MLSGPAGEPMLNLENSRELEKSKDMTKHHRYIRNQMNLQQQNMVYSWAIYKNQEDEIINFHKQQIKHNLEQWKVHADRWETEIDRVKMTYFVSSQKLIISGDEARVKELAAQYKRYIMDKQREQGVDIDRNLLSRRS